MGLIDSLNPLNMLFDTGQKAWNLFDSVTGTSAKRTKAAQEDLMRQNQEFQSGENEKSRAFARDFWNEQFDKTANYNSFSSVVRRALDAGINPSALFQNGAPSQFQPSTASASYGQASPSPSYGDVVNPVNRGAEAFSSVAQGLRAISEAKKLGVESSKVGALMDAQTKDLLSQAGLNDVRQKSEDFELGLRRIYGNKLYDSELGRNYAQMVNYYANSYLAAEEGNTQESVRQLNMAKRLYNDALRRSTDKQIEFVNMQLSWFPREMEAKIRNYTSQANLFDSEKTLADMRSDNVKFWNDLNKQERASLASDIRQRTNNAIKEGKILDSQVKQVEQLTRQLELENDWYVANQIFDKLDRVAGRVLDLKTIKVQQQNADTKGRFADSYQQDVEGRHGDTFTDVTNTYDAQGRKHTQTRVYRSSEQRYRHR